MRDDDELRTAAEAIDEFEEAIDVDLVKRGVDLVEDVERAWTSEHQGERKAKRSHRLFATGQDRQRADLLACRLDLQLDTRLGYLHDGVDILALGLGLRSGLILGGVGRVELDQFGRFDETEVPTATREEGADHLGEACLDRGIRRLEAIADLGAELAHQLA